MPSNQTPNYKLSQWERTDKVQMEDFNADNAKIDGALKAQDSALAAEASARQSADAAEAQARAALAGQLSKLGNCKIWTTSYQGSGKCGRRNPTKVAFPKKPLLAAIHTNGGGTVIWITARDGVFETPETNWLTWSGSTASWYAETTQPENQLNHSDLQYIVVALIAMDQ